MKTHKRSRILLLLLIGATLAFIWTRSMKSRAASAAESAAVMELLMPLLELFVGGGNVTDHLVRKLAHFCEFGLLGVEVSAWLALREEKQGAVWSLPFGFLVGAVDETIQYFVGRGNQFSDVVLDFGGYVCGLGGLRLLLWLIRRFHDPMQQEHKQ